MRPFCLLLLLLGCGGAAAPVLSLGGTYPTTIALLPGNTGLTATVEVTQQQPACGYSVSWTGTKNGSPNTIP